MHEEPFHMLTYLKNHFISKKLLKFIEPFNSLLERVVLFSISLNLCNYFSIVNEIDS